MSIEVGEISMNAPSVAPSIGPAINASSFDAISAFPINVNEGPAPMVDWTGFTELKPGVVDAGGTLGPIEALNSTITIAEPRSYDSFMDQGVVDAGSLDSTNPFGWTDYSYVPDRMGIAVEVIKNPFLDVQEAPFSKEPMQEPQEIFYQENQLVPEPIFMLSTSPVTIFEPTVQEVKAPRKIGLSIPDLDMGYAQPLVEPAVKEDPELETELEMVRQTIVSMKKQLATSSRRMENRAVEPELKSLIEEKQLIFKLVEKNEDQSKSSTKENKNPELARRKLIKDARALAARLFYGREAINKAFNSINKKQDKEDKEAKKGVTGEDVARYIPTQNDEVISGILKKRFQGKVLDGSLVLSWLGIKGIGKTTSKEVMAAQVEEAIHKNNPVTQSRKEEGEDATAEENEKVHMFVSKKTPLKWVEIVSVRSTKVESTHPVSNSNARTLAVVPVEENSIEDNQNKIDLRDDLVLTGIMPAKLAA